MKINKNYEKINDSYLFSSISKKIKEYKENNLNANIISLGIGDVTLPFSKGLVDSLCQASIEMGDKKTFKGYGPEQGYNFLREDIINYYKKRNIELDAKEIFISDGAKSDLGNIIDLFDVDNRVLITNPCYPVYVDTNVMAGREIVYLDSNEENGFLPMPDEHIRADLIYLCSPNNPTGAAYNKEQLAKWVKYALANEAIIIFDAAYEAFIEEDDIPRSIYEIKDAKRCAIELCSLSKTAGFTGLRLGYAVFPLEQKVLNSMWTRRQTTKFNGVPYIVQKAASYVFNHFDETYENILYYKENAKKMMKVFDELNIWYTGGNNSPYIWIKIPNNMNSWNFFDFLLEKAQVVGTPGIGFGKEGYFRFSSFGDKKNTEEALRRIKEIL